PMIRRSVRLEVVDADLVGGMHRPPWLGEERRDVAGGAARRPVEQLLSVFRGTGIEAARGRRRRRYRQLIELQRRQPRRNPIVSAGPDVAESGARGDGELRLVVEPRIEEDPRAVHLEVGDE